MKYHLFLMIALAAFLPMDLFGQGNQWLHHMRFANMESSVTTYNRSAGQASAISIDKILANPKLICDLQNSTVTHFTITLVPRGGDLYTSTTIGNELKDQVKNKLRELKEAGTKTKIVVESIEINMNGKTEPITGALFYECK